MIVEIKTLVRDLKKLFEKEYPSYYPERQAFFLDKTSPALANSECLASHGLTNECELFFHDLGAQRKVYEQIMYIYTVGDQNEQLISFSPMVCRL